MASKLEIGACVDAGVALSAIPAGSTGVMMTSVEKEFGWSRVEVYSGTSLVSFQGVILATLIGLAIDRVGPRRIGICAAAILCGGIASLSMVRDSLWQWWACWALVGVAVAAMPAVWLAPIVSQFNAAKGLAIAIVLSGSGLATFFVPVLSASLVQAYGWRTGYLALGTLWAMTSLPVIVFFFKPVSDPHHQRESAKAVPPENRFGLTTRQGFRSPSFYKLLFGAFGGVFGGVALVLNMVPILVWSGTSMESAAKIAGLVGVSTILGRVASGWLMDRLSAKLIAAGSTLAASILPVALLTYPGSAGAATIGVLCYGLAGGAKIGALAYLASRHLGNRAFGTLYGTISAAVALAVGFAPLVANYLYDATGSYEVTMLAAVPILAVASILYLLLPIYPNFEPDIPVPLRRQFSTP